MYDPFGPFSKDRVEEWSNDSTAWIASGAWFNNPAIKEAVLAKLKEHRAADGFIQASYQVWAPGQAESFKGCALGCMVPWRDTENPEQVPDYLKLSGDVIEYSSEVELRFAILEDVANLIDNVFEAQEDFSAAGDFALAVVEAIAPGADLSEVGDRYFALNRRDGVGNMGPIEHGRQVALNLIQAISEAPHFLDADRSYEDDDEDD